MRLGSLCSGAGGLDLAVERVFAARTLWHCEINDAASKVLAYRWDAPNHSDLINTDWSTVEPIDILCAGWPCQPFSLAGKQKGADDERAIWPSIAGAIRVLRPRIVCLENVSAVLGTELHRVADSLSALGYDLAWTCLRASDVGAPHRRDRLFIVAHADGGRLEVSPQRHCEPARSELEASQRRDAGGRGVTVADPESDGRREGRAEPARQLGGSDAPAAGGDGAVELLPTPAASNPNDSETPETWLTRRDEVKARLKNGNGMGMPLGIAVQLLQTPSTADGAGSRKARGGGRSNEPPLPGQAVEMATDWGKYAPAVTRWEQVAGPAPSPTEPNTKGNPRLNPAFSEWMMGWPAGWVTDVPGISRNDQLRIIGNGVVPQCAEAALRHLLSLEVAA